MHTKLGPWWLHSIPMQLPTKLLSMSNVTNGPLGRLLSSTKYGYQMKPAAHWSCLQ
jgi:hypothetical protein